MIDRRAAINGTYGPLATRLRPIRPEGDRTFTHRQGSPSSPDSAAGGVRVACL